MSDVVISRRHTTWDVILGILLIIGGLIILSDVALATTVTVKFLGWMLVLAGILGLISALFNMRGGGFWSSAIASGLALVLGLMFLRHTTATALTLTLIAGALFLSTGLVRLAASFTHPEYRWPLLIGGGISTILGLIVLFNLFDATLTLLGILLGIQVLVEGIAMVLLGRVRVTAV